MDIIIEINEKIYLHYFIIPIIIFSQNFTRQDTLRGSITPERAWWDLTYYHLDILLILKINLLKEVIQFNTRFLESKDEIQIDLQKPLKITKVLQNNRELTFRMDGYSHFIKLKKKQKKGEY